MSKMDITLDITDDEVTQSVHFRFMKQELFYLSEEEIANRIQKYMELRYKKIARRLRMEGLESSRVKDTSKEQMSDTPSQMTE